MPRTFRIGERVKWNTDPVVDDRQYGPQRNEEGVIVGIEEDGHEIEGYAISYFVDFSVERPGFHEGDEHLERPTGWWCFPHEIKACGPPPLSKFVRWARKVA